MVSFQKGALATLTLAKKLGCTKALLKSKSPSCGHEKIYDDTLNGTQIYGDF